MIRPNVKQKNKKTKTKQKKNENFLRVYFAVLVNNKEKKDEQVFRPCNRTNKSVQHEDDRDTKYSSCSCNAIITLKRGLEELENIVWIEVIQTKDCWDRPGPWKLSWRPGRQVIIQNLMRDHQLTLL